MGLIFISPSTAWIGVVVSICGMIMLGVLAALYATGHETFVGSTDSPSRENAVELAWNMVWAIVIYAGFTVFCFSQIALHKRASRRGEISL